MNCPKCGSEISENQKFCSNCGANLENLEENTTENFTEEKSNMDIKQFFKKNLVVIISACVIGLPLIAFGTVKAVDYHNKIKPFSVSSVGNKETIKFAFKYNPKNKTTDIEVIEEDVIVDDWQIDIIKEIDDIPTFKIADKDNLKAPSIKFDSYKLVKGKPAITKFKIQNQNFEDYVNNKKLFQHNQLNVIVPMCISFRPEDRIKTKEKYDKLKAKEEQERIRREQIVSNCVYKTSDGTCFTTKIFKAEPIKDFNKIDKYNYWLGAKDACESKGYRLPNDKELRSLFSDILGIEIYSGIDVKSEKYSDSNIPTNFEILRKIAPKQEHDNIYLWENETFDEDRALVRSKGDLWNSDETHQYIADKFGYKNIYYKERAICVYDPNGKPHKSLLETTKEKELQLKQQEEQRQKTEQIQHRIEKNKEAENELF